MTWAWLGRAVHITSHMPCFIYWYIGWRVTMYISKATLYLRCLVQACTSLYKTKKTGRRKMVKLGIFIHKADHVLLNSSTYKMTSLTQDRARHNNIKILYERGSITEAKYVCIGGGIMFRCQILVRDGRWVRNLR